MTAPAPARFSTTTVWPNIFSSCGCIARAAASVAPPAGNGTMKRNGLPGNACACACVAAAPARSRMGSASCSSLVRILEVPAVLVRLVFGHRHLRGLGDLGFEEGGEFLRRRRRRLHAHGADAPCDFLVLECRHHCAIELLEDLGRGRLRRGNAEPAGDIETL